MNTAPAPSRARPDGTGRPQSLSYVLITPARNEAAYIGYTLRSVVKQTSPPLRWVVVSDGSTDRTAAIAEEIGRREPSVSVIVFEENRGYGAAIKAGFECGTGDLVAFLDADGTCDPDYFAELCRAVPGGNMAISRSDRCGRDTVSSAPCSTMVGTVIGGRVARWCSIWSKRGSPGALPWRWR